MRNFLYLIILLNISCSEGDKKKITDSDGNTSHMTQIIKLPSSQTSNWYLGTGVNSLSKGYRSQCIDSTEIKYQGRRPTNNMTLHFKWIKTQEDLFNERSLDITAKANIAKASTIEGVKKDFNLFTIHEDKSYALVIGRKTWSLEGLKRYKFTEDIERIITKNPERFFELCGDEFISDLSRVTEVYGIMECSNYNTYHKNQIDQTIKGGSTNTNAAISDASIKSKLVEISIVAEGNCKMFTHVRGGQSIEFPTKFETFVSDLVSFLSTTKYEHANPVEIHTKKYSETAFNIDIKDILDKNKFNYKFVQSIMNMKKTGINSRIKEIYRLLELKKLALRHPVNTKLLNKVDRKLNRIKISIDESIAEWSKCVNNPVIKENCGLSSREDDVLLEN